MECVWWTQETGYWRMGTEKWVGECNGITGTLKSSALWAPLDLGFIASVFCNVFLTQKECISDGYLSALVCSEMCSQWHHILVVQSRVGTIEQQNQNICEHEKFWDFRRKLWDTHRWEMKPCGHPITFHRWQTALKADLHMATPLALWEQIIMDVQWKGCLEGPCHVFSQVLPNVACPLHLPTVPQSSPQTWNPNAGGLMLNSHIVPCFRYRVHQTSGSRGKGGQYSEEWWSW